MYARELVRRGAAKVYGAARDPPAVTEPGVTPVGLDITDPELVAEAAARCADVSLLVNNAGVMQASTLVVAVHAGFINTDMAALVDAPKISPESVAQQACDAIKAGQVEVLAD